MDPVLVAHLAATSAYAGFQWTVQILVYRQFPLVTGDAFTAYELGHQRRISLLVGPLLLALLVTTGLVLARRPDGVPLPLVAGSATTLAVIIAVTVLAAVPLHGRLARGWDAGAHRALLRWDLVRAMAATLAVALSAAALL